MRRGEDNTWFDTTYAHFIWVWHAPSTKPFHSWEYLNNFSRILLVFAQPGPGICPVVDEKRWGQMGSRPRRHCVAVDVEDVEVEAATGAKLTSADGDIAWYTCTPCLT